jgi:hypothetical protein
MLSRSPAGAQCAPLESATAPAGAHRPNITPSNKELLWQIFKFITPREKQTLAAACVAMSLTSLTNLAFPRVVATLVDGMARHEPPRRRFLASALLLFAAGAAGSWLRTFLFAVANESVATRLRVQLVKRLLQQDMAFFDSTRVQDMLTRITEDTQVTAAAATANLAKAYRYVNSALGGEDDAAPRTPLWRDGACARATGGRACYGVGTSASAGWQGRLQMD